MKHSTRDIVLSSMFAALICIATMLIKIQLTPNGYVNLGDGVIIFAAGALGPVYAFFAAGIGSMLADIISGFAFYAPATFVIKGLMAVAVFFVRKRLAKAKNRTVTAVISAVSAEAVMIVGYAIFESAVYGIGVAMASMLGNAVQAFAGIVTGVLLIKIFEKNRFFR